MSLRVGLLACGSTHLPRHPVALRGLCQMPLRTSICRLVVRNRQGKGNLKHQNQNQAIHTQLCCTFYHKVLAVEPESERRLRRKEDQLRYTDATSGGTHYIRWSGRTLKALSDTSPSMQTAQIRFCLICEGISRLCRIVYIRLRPPCLLLQCTVKRS